MTPQEPTRHHSSAHLLRWTEPGWTLDRFGCTRWKVRWYTNEVAARQFADRLTRAGATVHLDRYAVEFTQRRRFGGER